MKSPIPSACFRLFIGLCLTAPLAFGQAADHSFKTGKPEIQSVSQLAFGPNGIMFIGDSVRGSVFAIDTAATKYTGSPVKVEVRGINAKIAGMLGIAPDQLLINDVEVDPMSKNVYVSVSRGRGPEATQLIFRVDPTGKLAEYPLNNVKYSMVSLLSLPDAKPGLPPGRNPAGPINADPRIDTITDMQFVDGKILVAGLSNEEFASDLRAIPYPFKTAEKGTGVRIWHASHGQYETASPVRTFIPYMVNKKQNILAAYTCTPLVRIPVDSLKPGSKVVGETVAEVGNSNRPLEMIAYNKGGHEYILLANSRRGLMKLSADTMDTVKVITPPSTACEASSEKEGYRAPANCQTQLAGLPVETLADMKGVWQLSRMDDNNALVLTDASGAIKFVPGIGAAQAPEPTGMLDLVTIPLP